MKLVHEAIEMMSYFRSKGVLQRTTFRGVLEISPHLKIPVIIIILLTFKYLFL